MYTPQRGYSSQTTLGMSEPLERALCYVLGWLTGIFFLVFERQNETVRRHAKQSILVFGVLSILGWFVGLFGGLLSHIWVIGFFFGLGFGLIGWLIVLVTIVAWISLILMALSSPRTIFVGSRSGRYM